MLSSWGIGESRGARSEVGSTAPQQRRQVMGTDSVHCRHLGGREAGWKGSEEAPSSMQGGGDGKDRGRAWHNDGSVI